MTKDDYQLDQIERSQEDRSRRRRENRSRRSRLFVFVSLLLIALVIFAAPSLLSHSPLGRSLITRAAAQYGLNAKAKSVRIGWITPLQIKGLTILGEQAGSEITIDQIDTRMTVREMIGNGVSDFGEIVVRGVDVKCSVSAGQSSLEQDLHALLQPSDDSASSTFGTVDVQDATVTITDALTGNAWVVAQSNVNIELATQTTRLTFAGVVNDPTGGGGGLQGSAEFGSGDGQGPLWQMSFDSESMPLSVVTLVNRRFPDETSSFPQNISGDATGAVHAIGFPDGTIDATVDNLQIRGLRAAEPVTELGVQPRVWTNALASVNGQVKLVDGRVIGRGIHAQADFASATLDGSFSSSMTLSGANDNPLRWLEALDGTAHAEIDLAHFDQALPGLLPLRDGAQLISGRATAQIESLPSNQGRRSKLTIRSDALRARAQGRPVVIEPIEIEATVLDDQGQVRAEAFELKSSFASAIGNGDLQSGDADFQIDFGRLASTLRPIVDLSQINMGGTASGKIHWKATEQDLWELRGNANATNLLVTLPSGHSIKRRSMQAGVEAIGRWGEHTLSELTRAKIEIKSSGLNLNANLTSAVRNPAAATPLPIHIDSDGRIETLMETLGPWLPAELHDGEGGFDLHANAEASTDSAQLTDFTLELKSPRLAYGDRWFSQPSVKIHFDGEYAWPSGELRSRSLTVAGDAVSLAMKGEMTPESTDLEVAWRAKLERIQGSVQKRLAQNRRWGSNVQAVGFRPGSAREAVQTDDWLVTGDCQGSLTVKTKGRTLEIQSDSSGTNVSVIQPPDASAQSYTVGPMPQRNFGDYQIQQASSAPRVVWSEPNLRINGLTRYELDSGRVLADAMQLSGDWFATTLTGHAVWNEQLGDIVLHGPARLKMDEVSRRLTTLTGAEILVEGIHETPIEIHAARDAEENVAFTVKGNLGWDVGEIAGVAFGKASVPVTLTETTIAIAPAAIPVGQGQVNLAGDVFYRPGPIWLRAQPGVVAQNLRLTPEMTNRWLKYLAPVAADAARIDGLMSVELDEAIVVVDAPEQSRVRGRIKVDGVTMTAGPLATQIIGGIDQLKSLVRLSGPAETRDNTTLLTMRPQSIDFELDRGVVTHERLFFNIDRAEIMTSGQVSFDSRVNISAHVPLDERWLGKDLQSLANQQVTLPINGTLSRPKLDVGSIRNVAAKLGTQALDAGREQLQEAVQSTAENYIQQQFNKGIDKIFGSKR